MSALIGINPKNKRCEIAGENSAEIAEDIRKAGCIAVPVSLEQARRMFCEPVHDIYALCASTAPQVTEVAQP